MKDRGGGEMTTSRQIVGKYKSDSRCNTVRRPTYKTITMGLLFSPFSSFCFLTSNIVPTEPTRFAPAKQVLSSSSNTPPAFFSRKNKGIGQWSKKGRYLVVLVNAGYSGQETILRREQKRTSARFEYFCRQHALLSPFHTCAGEESEANRAGWWLAQRQRCLSSTKAVLRPRPVQNSEIYIFVSVFFSMTLFLPQCYEHSRELCTFSRSPMYLL